MEFWRSRIAFLIPPSPTNCSLEIAAVAMVRAVNCGPDTGIEEIVSAVSAELVP